MAASLPPQDELRRRLRAARVLRDLNVAELAALVDPEAGLGERTLRKLESGETQIRPQVLMLLSVALDFPYGWFEVEQIEAQFKPGAQFMPSADWTARVERLEARLATYEQGRPGSDANGGDPPSPAGTRSGTKRRGPRGTRQARSRS